MPSTLFILLCFFSLHVALSVPNPNTPPTENAYLTPASTQPYVLFASRSASLLFINGHFKRHVRGWGHVGHVQHALKRGDVISIYASGASLNKQGLIAAVYFGNPTHNVVYTGDGHWKAIALSRHTWKYARHWTEKDGSSCRWPAPKTTPKRRYYQKHLRSFPTSARVVWANAANRRTAVLFRYVVGGEQCNKYLPTITFASRDKAWLYINGKFQGLVSHWNQVKMVHAKLPRGTVIALKVRGKRRKQGVVVDIALNTEQHMVTGQPGWKVIRGHMRERKNPKGWRSGQYKSCHWRPAVVLSRKPQRRIAPNFPYGEGARYVWTDRAGRKGVMLLRYVVGGERCVPQVPDASTKTAELSLSSDNEAIIFVNGKVVLRTDSWRSVGKAVVHVKDGDVFGVLARDGGLWFGVRVGLLVDGKEMGTGVGDWRVRGSRNVEKSWTSPGFGGCHWPKPVKADGGSLFETEVPKVHGQSHHVWAKETKTGDDIVARFVLGGLC